MDGPSKLPRRQQQVLDLLRNGYSEKQIALSLALSKHTVHIYVKALYRRFGASSLGELLSHWASRQACPACGLNFDPLLTASRVAPANSPSMVLPANGSSTSIVVKLDDVSRRLLSVLNDAEVAGADVKCRAEIRRALASTYAATARAIEPNGEGQEGQTGQAQDGKEPE